MLSDQYSRPLPEWVWHIKEEVKNKVRSSIAAQECREGNIPTLRQLLIVFWPFVDKFPKIIRRGCAKFLKHEFITNPEKAGDLLSLLFLADKTLMLIERDEAEHRELWIKAAEAAGLTYHHLEQPPTPLVKDLITEVETWTDTAAMFLRFTAVEIMAEVASEHFLESERFRKALGTKGLEWFLAHTKHGDESHESLTYRLAFAFHENGITKEKANALIQPVIDLAVEAAESVAEHTTPPARPSRAAQPCRYRAVSLKRKGGLPEGM